MKLQVAFDVPDLDKALAALPELSKYATIIEIGSLLIYKYGDQAIKQFRQLVPEGVLLADAKICDRGKEATTLFAQAGADWVTVMAGTKKSVIRTACTTAHEAGKKVMLDLLDASSPGQAALDAKSLGADALVFNRAVEDAEWHLFLDSWEMVRGNTQLPIFIAGITKQEALADVLPLNPDGIIISLSTDTFAQWQETVQFFHKVLIEGQ